MVSLISRLPAVDDITEFGDSELVKDTYVPPILSVVGKISDLTDNVSIDDVEVSKGGDDSSLISLVSWAGEVDGFAVESWFISDTVETLSEMLSEMNGIVGLPEKSVVSVANELDSSVIGSAEESVVSVAIEVDISIISIYVGDIRSEVDGMGSMLVDWSSGVAVESIGDDLVRVSVDSSGLLDVASGGKPTGEDDAIGLMDDVVGSMLVDWAPGAGVD